MKSLGPVAATCGALVLGISLSAYHLAKVDAAAALTQAKAEKLASVTTINGCNADPAQLPPTAKLATTDPSSRISEKSGPATGATTSASAATAPATGCASGSALTAR